jgi:hypothetical protein
LNLNFLTFLGVMSVGCCVFEYLMQYLHVIGSTSSSLDVSLPATELLFPLLVRFFSFLSFLFFLSRRSC